MRAELTIEHDDGDLLAEFVAVLGPHDPAVMAQSNFAQKSPQAASALSYAAYGAPALVLAWATPGQLFVYLEPSGGRLRRAASDVWDIVRKSGSALNPHLKALVLLDEDANDEVANASVGLLSNLRRPEIAFTMVTGVVTLVWLVVALTVFQATGDLVLGAIPPLLASFIATTSLVADTRRQKLVWR